MTDQRRRVREVLQTVDHVEQVQAIRQVGQLFAARAFLQAHQLNSRDAGQRREGKQGHGPLPVACVLRVALTGDADFESLNSAQLTLPMDSHSGVDTQIRDVRGNGRQGCANDPREAQQRCLDVKRR